MSEPLDQDLIEAGKTTDARDEERRSSLMRQKLFGTRDVLRIGRFVVEDRIVGPADTAAHCLQFYLVLSN